ncbi:hypothetical protein evm_001833 [Chilo suppressalis]|nr:hypothetical protein evm_001833 [Chilo suppressalis]
MRLLTLLLSVLVAACLVSSTPINPSRILINHPTDGPYSRARRSPQYVKQLVPTYNRRQYVASKLETNLRKGEYVCGNKVCRLKPGVPPANCDGCQYPLALTNGM